MQAATLMYEPIPELLSFVDSQWCLYSRLFHAGGLGMRNFLCGFHSYLRQTSFSSTGNLQSQFLQDNIHSIMHQWNSLPYSISASRLSSSEICLNQSFHHSTFMLSFRKEDWGIFRENLHESWFFWGNPYQFLSFAGFVTHGQLGRQDLDHDGKVHFEAALIAFMSNFLGLWRNWSRLYPVEWNNSRGKDGFEGHCWGICVAQFQPKFIFDAIIVVRSWCCFRGKKIWFHPQVQELSAN